MRRTKKSGGCSQSARPSWDDPADGEDNREFSERYQPAGNGPIGPEAAVLFEILELVRDAQLEEEDQAGDERDDEGREFRKSSCSIEQRREADCRAAESDHQWAVCENGEAFPLINPPFTFRHRADGKSER